MADQTLGNAGQAATTVPWLPRKALKEVTKDKPKAADAARKLSRVAREFARIDAAYAPGRKCPWLDAYEEMLKLAEDVRHYIGRPVTDHERALRNWSRRIAPSDGDVARTPWASIEGLSRRFAWLQVTFEAALFREAKLSIPFNWVTYRRYQNPWGKHAKLLTAYQVAGSKLHSIARHILFREIPRTEADRLLIRRAVDVRFYNSHAFELKYRRAVRKHERELGLHLPERRIKKPPRLTMVCLDYDSKNPLMKFPISDSSLNKLVVRYLPGD